MSGYEVVTATSAFDTVSNKSVTATCSVGKVPLGGGASMTGATIDLKQSFPTGTGWTAIGDGGGANYSVTAHVLCGVVLS